MKYLNSLEIMPIDRQIPDQVYIKTLVSGNVWHEASQALPDSQVLK